MNQELLKHLSTLRETTPHPVYLVGGAVRDLLLGHFDLKDIDLLIPSGSDAVARDFAKRINGSFFVLDEERRISRVVKNLDDTFLQFDFADLIGADLETDLGRRDFTINAMALDLTPFSANTKPGERHRPLHRQRGREEQTDPGDTARRA